ncbi:PilZ domain-containing protein [Bradyrhizobium sp. 186]|nr:PilZ domain-containing protein [Bradyrhizobium sp. 186]
MMGNKRRADRVRFEHKHTVSIMGVDGTWRRSCILLDASESGAKLEVEGSTDPLKAQEFFLVLSSTGLAFRRCELIWVDGSQVGVQYVTAKKKGKASAEKCLARSQSDELLRTADFLANYSVPRCVISLREPRQRSATARQSRGLHSLSFQR